MTADLAVTEDQAQKRHRDHLRHRYCIARIWHRSFARQEVNCLVCGQDRHGDLVVFLLRYAHAPSVELMATVLNPGCGFDDCEGECGERGERGHRGHRGHRGKRGHDGATGPTGPCCTGPTGPTGSGSTGSTGPTGPMGLTGAGGAFALKWSGTLIETSSEVRGELGDSGILVAPPGAGAQPVVVPSGTINRYVFSFPHTARAFS